jgi:hypothetical protein
MWVVVTSLCAGRVTQARQVSTEEPEDVCPTVIEQEGLLGQLHQPS